MASKMNMMSLFLIILVTLLCARTNMAQSDCTNVLIGMAPCLNYVSGSSSTPSAQCCFQLASVVRTNPRCLCTVLNGGGASLGVSINQTLALALPGACNVQTPPVSRCNAAGSPVGSPEAIPGDESAGTGSKTRGGSGTSNSKAIIINTPLILQLVLSFLFVAWSF